MTTKTIQCDYTEIAVNDFSETLQKEVVDFLFRELERFRDPREDIEECVKYIVSPHHGGRVFVARHQGAIAGAVLLAQTNMRKFVPAYLLVYIATDENLRGNGIGKQLVQMVQKAVNQPIALHVEHDNPARRLYEREGFTSKYAEMRWYPSVDA